MQFHLNEGSFTLPDGLRDNSMNMLLTGHSGLDLSLIITRDRLEPGESFEAFRFADADQVRKPRLESADGVRVECFRDVTRGLRIQDHETSIEMIEARIDHPETMDLGSGDPFEIDVRRDLGSDSVTAEDFTGLEIPERIA